VNDLTSRNHRCIEHSYSMEILKIKQPTGAAGLQIDKADRHTERSLWGE
jgi:hypothetical protein